MNMQRAELFLISRDVVAAASMEEVDATYADMQELGIAHMPYGLVDIDINAKLSFPDDGNDMMFLLCDDSAIGSPPLTGQPRLDQVKTMFRELKSDDKRVNVKIKFQYRDGKCELILVWVHDTWFELHSGGWHRQCAEFRETAERYKKLLVVALATREIVKTRTKDKLLAMGIGKHKRDNHRPIYTTTISLPIRSVSGASGPASSHAGISLRPHLRRGHPRQQRHGPNFEYIKKIWVPPCFVNADDGYVSTRFSYNTSRRSTEGQPNETR